MTARKTPRTNKKLSQMIFGKEGIYIRLDTSVLKFFRDSGPRWQTRINDVLKKFMEDNQ